LPPHAQISNRFTILRSMAHTGGGHPAGSLQLLSGDPDVQDKKAIYPDFMSAANHLRFDQRRSLPHHVGVNAMARYDNITIGGPAYLGGSYRPFAVTGDPNAPTFRVPKVGLAKPREERAWTTRAILSKDLDTLRRHLDRSRAIAARDRFREKALNLLTNRDAARAFALNLEKSRVRERYGRKTWEQQLLLARRLVEAGVELITTELSGPLCGRVQNWDDRAYGMTNQFDLN
jgi:hypothetical protein